MNLNARSLALVEEVLRDSRRYNVAADKAICGTRIIDCSGSGNWIELGPVLARIAMADLASVRIRASDDGKRQFVDVETDAPLLACMASQYAGWEIKTDGYFAMGSGPMRAAAGREPLFDEIGCRERADACVGVLESAKLPPDEVCRDVAAKCGIEPQKLTLLVAPTHSRVGMIQVVARSVETAMHKLHALGFDLERVVAGRGSAEIPPTTDDDLTAIGWTNDSILYGGEVVLSVRGDDASIEAIGPQIPSSASRDYGRPFKEILASFDYDFYRIDPLLFSPAKVRLENVETGGAWEFGAINPGLLAASWGGG